MSIAAGWHKSASILKASKASWKFHVDSIEGERLTLINASRPASPFGATISLLALLCGEHVNTVPVIYSRRTAPTAIIVQASTKTSGWCVMPDCSTVL